MSKKIKTLLVIFIICLSLSACKQKEQVENTTTDEVTGVTQEVDDGVLQYRETISNGQFEELTYEEVYQIFTNGLSFTGLIYAGRETCPYCQRAIEIYSVASKTNDFHIYYLDSTNAKTSETYEEYGFDFIKDENGEVLTSVPTIYALKDGKVVASYTGVADDYSDASIEPSYVQKAELIERIEFFKELISK